MHYMKVLTEVKTQICQTQFYYRYYKVIKRNTLTGKEAILEVHGIEIWINVPLKDMLNWVWIHVEEWSLIQIIEAKVIALMANPHRFGHNIFYKKMNMFLIHLIRTCRYLLVYCFLYKKLRMKWKSELHSMCLYYASWG